MKQLNLHKYAILLCFCLTFVHFSVAQVGINTTSPEGILDANSTTWGVVLPRVALTDAVTESPVTNPNGGSLAIGTTVYNTSTTNTGTNDVTPGMYSWSGSRWLGQFHRKQYELYESGLGIRSRSNVGYANISGLTGQSFTADYTGNYKVQLTVNYGGGGARVPRVSNGTSDGYLNIARQHGEFRLDFDGTNYDLPVYTYSTAYDGTIGATNYFAIWQESTMVFFIQLEAGDTVNFGLTFDQLAATEFINNGNSSTGRGYVAYDIPCRVEISYFSE